MTLRELLKFLNKIKKCHPDAADAAVWAVFDEDNNYPFQINNVGYDQKHKPARIKLGE